MLPGVDVEEVFAGGAAACLVEEGTEGGEVVDGDLAVGHGDDEPGSGQAEGEGFGGEADADVLVGSGVVDVHGAVPAGGDEEGVKAAVDELVAWGGVGAQDFLLVVVVAAVGGVEEADILIEADGEEGGVIVAPADIEDRCATWNAGLADKGGFAVRGVVVDRDGTIPAADGEFVTGGGEAEGGDGVGGGIGEFVLCAHLLFVRSDCGEDGRGSLLDLINQHQFRL